MTVQELRELIGQKTEEIKGYTVSTDKSVFFESDELALKVQERFDCEKLDGRADFKVEFTPAA